MTPCGRGTTVPGPHGVLPSPQRRPAVRAPASPVASSPVIRHYWNAEIMSVRSYSWRSASLGTFGMPARSVVGVDGVGLSQGVGDDGEPGSGVGPPPVDGRVERQAEHD